MILAFLAPFLFQNSPLGSQSQSSCGPKLCNLCWLKVVLKVWLNKCCKQHRTNANFSFGLCWSPFRSKMYLVDPNVLIIGPWLACSHKVREIGICLESEWGQLGQSFGFLKGMLARTKSSQRVLSEAGPATFPGAGHDRFWRSGGSRGPGRPFQKLGGIYPHP